MLRPVDILVVFHTFLKCLRLGVHAAVDDTIKETNATNVFEFTGKALYQYTTIRVCFLSKKNCYSPHHTSNYQSSLITHQVPLILLLISLWMNLNKYIFIALVHHTRKISLLPDGQAQHAIPCRMTCCRDNYRKTLQSS